MTENPAPSPTSPSPPSPAHAVPVPEFRLARNTAIVIAGILASRISGVVREITLAHVFGLNADTDAYFQAFRLPDLMYLVMAGGALSAAFVPVFTRLRAREENLAAWKTMNVTLSWTLVGGGLLILAALLFAPLLTVLIAPGLSGPSLDLCTRLTRLFLPAQLFFLLGGLFAGILNVFQLFFLTALAPCIYNLALIGAALLLGPRWGVAAMATGVLGGALAGQILLFVPALRRLGASFRFTLDSRDPGFREILRQFPPIAVGICLAYLAFLITSAFATSCGPRAASAYNYAYRLFWLPLGLFGTGFAVSFFPAMSSDAAAGHLDDLRHKVQTGIRGTLFFCLPSAIFLGAWTVPVISLLLEHGHFTADDTRLTAQALLLFCLAIPLAGTQQLLSRACYALGEARMLVLLSLPGLALCLLLTPALRAFGVAGVALSYTLGIGINTLLLALGLGRKLPGMDRTFWSRLILLLLPGGVLTLALSLGLRLVPWARYFPGFHQVVAPLGAGLATATAYLALAWAQQAEEAAWLKRRLGF